MSEYGLASCSSGTYMLAEIFFEADVRIAGDVDNPLFCMVDVANKIGDDNGNQKVKNYSDRHKQTMIILDRVGRRQQTIMLTECGLYKYLMRSKRPEATEFQEWVYDQLALMRRRQTVAVKKAQNELQIEYAQLQQKYVALLKGYEKLRDLNRQHRQYIANRGYQRLADDDWNDYLLYCKIWVGARGHEWPRNKKLVSKIHEISKYHYNYGAYDEGCEAIGRMITKAEKNEADTYSDDPDESDSEKEEDGAPNTPSPVNVISKEKCPEGKEEETGDV